MVIKLMKHSTRKNNKNKSNQTKFRVGKAIKGKADKLYVKEEGYDNSFKSWIDNLTEFD